MTLKQESRESQQLAANVANISEKLLKLSYLRFFFFFFLQRESGLWTMPVRSFHCSTAVCVYCVCVYWQRGSKVCRPVAWAPPRVGAAPL